MTTKLIKNILSTQSDVESRYVKDYKDLKKLVDACKKLGNKVVLTQGVFDLIHEGHANYLEKARGYGDLLIVGIDSDELTRKRKGPNRPIVPQAERIRMLSHLRHVDVIALRDVQHGIGDLIKLIQPDVLIVSETTKDFDKKLQMEYKPYCAKIVILPAQSTSTTSARIRNLTMSGAQELAQEIKKLTDNFIEKIRTS